MCPTPCVSLCVYLTPCVSHSVCVFHSLSVPLCMSHSCIPPRVSHSVCISLGAYFTWWVSHSLPIPLCVSHSMYVLLRVYPTGCVSHSVRISLGAYPTPCRSLSMCPTPYVSYFPCIPCVIYSVCIPLHVCFAPYVLHSVRVPLLYSTPCILLCVHPTPWPSGFTPCCTPHVDAHARCSGTILQPFLFYRVPAARNNLYRISELYVTGTAHINKRSLVRVLLSKSSARRLTNRQTIPSTLVVTATIKFAIATIRLEDRREQGGGEKKEDERDDK